MYLESKLILQVDFLNVCNASELVIDVGHKPIGGLLSNGGLLPIDGLLSISALVNFGNSMF